MCRITKEDFYKRKEMKKGKKRHWGFTCPSCNKKYSSKTHGEYFLCEEHLTGILDELCLFCSIDCVFDYLETSNIDVDAIITEHNAAMDKLDELNGVIDHEN